jgi:hypothetical protein
MKVLRIEQLYCKMMQWQMGVPKAFHPLPFKRRGFHGLKPKFCKEPKEHVLMI